MLGPCFEKLRGALRAERKELLTVVLPQSLEKQSQASRELIQKVRASSVGTNVWSVVVWRYMAVVAVVHK